MPAMSVTYIRKVERMKNEVDSVLEEGASLRKSSCLLSCRDIEEKALFLNTENRSWSVR